MQLNKQQNRYVAQSSAGRKLIRRPMETPGLESTRSNVRNANVSHIYPPGNNSQCNSAYDDEHFQNNNTNPCSSYNSASHATFENSQYPSVSQSRFPQNNILGDPMIANVAVHYGQALVASGRQIVDKELEKYVAVSRLKYYFAVDSAYVGKKLSVILFPFLHTDWSVRYDQNEPIQPKFEINAPDLYIPTMAFLTYILVAGLSLGTKYEFTPEKLSIEATNALLWTTLEVIIALSTLYISNISTNLKTLDLIAYSSYKYVGIIITLLVSLLFGRFGYMLSLFYTVISLAFFLIRTLKLQILTEPMSYQKDVYGIPHSSPFSVQQMGLKRRQYFLLFVSFFQAILMWWLTWRII